MAYFETDWEWRQNHRSKWEKIKDWFKYNPIVEFFYDRYSNGICGPGFRSYRRLNEGRLALVLAIIGILSFILYIIF